MESFTGSEKMSAQAGPIWYCKIGEARPPETMEAADLPMREAVKTIFKAVTGEEPEYCFSGWYGELTEEEQLAIDSARLITQQEENVLDRIEVYLDKDGDWRWRAWSKNGRNVANSSEGYENFTDAKGMAMRLFPTTDIVEIKD